MHIETVGDVAIFREEDPFEVDGVRYHRLLDLHHHRLIANTVPEHECFTVPEQCDFDWGVRTVRQVKGDGLPSGSCNSDAYRWFPGDPVYVGGVR